MEEDVKSEEIIVLDKGVDGAFSVDMGCCPGGIGMAKQ